MLRNLNIFAPPAPAAAGATRQKLVLLALGALALLAAALFLSIQVTDWGFALPRRGVKLLAMVLVAVAVSYSSVIFQTITNNRILTPSIIGFDSLYMLIQTVMVFAFGALSLTSIDRNLHFVLNVGLVVVFAGGLFRWLFGREGRNLYFLILVGIVFGTLFGSISSFLQMIIDPNDFLVLQDRMFASINNVDRGLLAYSALGVLAAILYSLRWTRFLDVLSLGRDSAISLGVDHQRVVNRLMIVIAVLVSVATALVGPITFFGLLVANLAYQMLRTYRHALLLPAAALLSIVALVGGQLLVEHVFTFSTSLNVIINFIGGIYFIYLLLKETKA